MGIRKYVRDRKQVRADRAESGSHTALVQAMGGNSFTPNTFNTIPAGSKKLTESNSDRYVAGE